MGEPVPENTAVITETEKLLVPDSATGVFEEEKLRFYYISESEALYTYNEIFEENCYKLSTSSGSRGPVIKPGSIVIDCGANIGLFSLYCSFRARDLKVLAIEPIPENFKVLKANLDHLPFARCIQLALGSKREISTFHYFPHLPGESTRHPEERLAVHERLKKLANENLERTQKELPSNHDLVLAAANIVRQGEQSDLNDIGLREEFQIEVQRLSDVLLDIPGITIGLVKIDVEGDEFEILKGISDNDYERIQQFVLEVYSSQRVAEILTFLESKGYGGEHFEQKPSITGAYVALKPDVCFIVVAKKKR